MKIQEVKSKHKHPVQGKTLREKLRDIYLDHCTEYSWSDSSDRLYVDRIVRELMQAFQEAMMSCLPEKFREEIPKDTLSWSHAVGYNNAIKKMKANIQTLLDDTVDKHTD